MNNHNRRSEKKCNVDVWTMNSEYLFSSYSFFFCMSVIETANVLQFFHTIHSSLLQRIQPKWMQSLNLDGNNAPFFYPIPLFPSCPVLWLHNLLLHYPAFCILPFSLFPALCTILLALPSFRLIVLRPKQRNPVDGIGEHMNSPWCPDKWPLVLETATSPFWLNAW